MSWSRGSSRISNNRQEYIRRGRKTPRPSSTASQRVQPSWAYGANRHSDTNHRSIRLNSVTVQVILRSLTGTSCGREGCRRRRSHSSSVKLRPGRTRPESSFESVVSPCVAPRRLGRGDRHGVSVGKVCRGPPFCGRSGEPEQRGAGAAFHRTTARSLPRWRTSHRQARTARTHIPDRDPSSRGLQPVAVSTSGREANLAEAAADYECRRPSGEKSPAMGRVGLGFIDADGRSRGQPAPRNDPCEDGSGVVVRAGVGRFVRPPRAGWAVLGSSVSASIAYVAPDCFDDHESLAVTPVIQTGDVPGRNMTFGDHVLVCRSRRGRTRHRPAWRRRPIRPPCLNQP